METMATLNFNTTIPQLLQPQNIDTVIFLDVVNLWELIMTSIDGKYS